MGSGWDQSPAEKVDSSPAHQFLYSALMLGTSLPACEMSSCMESQTHNRQPGFYGRDLCRVLIVIFLYLLIERWMPLKACMGAHTQVIQEGHGCRPSSHLTASLLAHLSTHRMYMMTPMAQQSTGRPYRLPAYHLWGCKQDPSAGQYQPWPGPCTTHTHLLGWDPLLHYPESVFEGCVPPCPAPLPACPGIRGSTGSLMRPFSSLAR